MQKYIKKTEQKEIIKKKYNLQVLLTIFCFWDIFATKSFLCLFFIEKYFILAAQFN